jgi:Protein of unknown function (DUF3800)
MHILFVDESGTPPKPTTNFDRERFFVIGGAIIRADAWPNIRNKLLGLKARRRIRGEFKWRYFAPGNTDGANPFKELDRTARDEVRSEIFGIMASEKGLTCLACVADASSAYAYENLNSQDDLYHATYKPLTERFQYFLQDFGRSCGRKEFGIVVSDHRGTRDDKRLRQHHDKLLHSSSEFTSRYPNLIESLFLQPSNLSVGIQLADMIAGAVWRKFQRGDDRWFNLIEQSFRKAPDGRVDGSGVVRFPKHITRKDAG